MSFLWYFYFLIIFEGKKTDELWPTFTCIITALVFLLSLPDSSFSSFRNFNFLKGLSYSENVFPPSYISVYLYSKMTIILQQTRPS